MKTNCPAWWTDNYIARQCEQSIKPLASEDIMLILPVTNPDTRITYGNAFCAYCHNDRNFQPWVLVPSCTPSEPVPIPRQEPQPESPLNPNNPTVSIFVSTNPFLSSYTVPTGQPVQTVVDVYLYQQFVTSTNGNFMPISPVAVSTSYNQNRVVRTDGNFIPINPVTASASYNQNRFVRTDGNFMPISPVAVFTSYNQNGVANPDGNHIPFNPVTFSTSYNPNHNVATSANANHVQHSPVMFSTSYNQNGRSQYSIRRARQSEYKEYSAYQTPYDSNEVWKYAKFDSNSKRFISTYNNVNFVCEIGPKLPDDMRKNVRICVPNLIDTCPPGTDTVQVQFCRESTSIVYNKYTKRAYRNKYCAFCNMELKTYLTGCVEKTEDEYFRSFKPSLGGIHGGTDPCSRLGASKTLNCLTN